MITVVITNYKRLDLCTRLLESIEEPRPRIVLVDDGSDMEEDIRSTVGSYPQITCSFAPHGGLVKAYNIGIRLVRTGYVLLLDNDVILPRGFFAQLLSALPEQFSVVGLVSTKDVKLAYDGPRLQEPATELAGYCMLFATETWRQIDGFDEHFRAYRADSDFCLRACSYTGISSFRLHFPKVFHEEHATLKGFSELQSDESLHHDLKYFHEKWGMTSVEAERMILDGIL